MNSQYRRMYEQNNYNGGHSVSVRSPSTKSYYSNVIISVTEVKCSDENYSASDRALRN